MWQEPASAKARNYAEYLVGVIVDPDRRYSANIAVKQCKPLSQSSMLLSIAFEFSAEELNTARRLAP